MKALIYNVLSISSMTIFLTLCPGYIVQADGAVGGGESGSFLDFPSLLLQPLCLTLHGTMATAVDNNPNVLLNKERIEAARLRLKS